MAKVNSGSPVGNTFDKNLKAAENALKAWTLRRAGYTFKEIGAQLGISKSQAHRYIQADLEEYRVKTSQEAQDYIAIETARLEAIMRTFQPKAATGNATAAEIVLKTHDRIAKLHGLDLPTKVAPTDPTGEREFSGGGIGLSALLEEARKARKK